MCGICGIYNHGNEPVSAERIIQMRDIMIDRGPDDAGIYIGDHIGLGHRRLSIIDLSIAAGQPMCNEDGRIWIAVNGEIYNFKEIRAKLEIAGHIFKSNSDSEVVAHGYEEWGEFIFEKLNGMYALAIWDSNKERLILSRDRAGKKPLYYAEYNGSVVFASDIKSVAACLGNLEIDEAAIDCFLTHLCVPQQHAIFKGIKKVQPAHYVIFDKNKTLSSRYWRLSFKNKEIMDAGQIIEKTIELTKEAIKDRMESDVPLGVFLSGGIDSSLIVALMSQLSGQTIKTFSVGFEYEQFNELPYAKKVADKYNTDHHEFIMKVNCFEVLPKLIWNYGEPFADSSAIPSYYISKIASEHIKVALTGDGGDESFAGYDRIQDVYRALLYKKFIPRFVSNNFISPFFGILGNMADNIYLFNRLKHYENYIKEGARSKYKNMMGSFYLREGLYSEQFKEKLKLHHPSHVYEGFYDQADGEDDVDKALFVDINTILPDDYQVKMDVASMSNSLEVRSPFLDYRVMEYAAKIPSNFKLKFGQSKYILKKIAEKYLPEKDIYRKKQGFAAPIEVWFRGDLKRYIYSIILSDKAKKRGYFDYGFIKHLLDAHVQNGADNSHRIWSLLWLELWHRMFIDKEISKGHSLKDLL